MNYIVHEVTKSQTWLSDLGFPDSSFGKESTCNAGDPSSIPGLGRSTGEGIGYPLQYSWASLEAQLVKNPPAMWETWIQSGFWRSLGKGKGYPLQYSGLENSMDYRVAKTRIRLSDFHFHFSILILSTCLDLSASAYFPFRIRISNRLQQKIRWLPSFLLLVTNYIEEPF